MAHHTAWLTPSDCTQFQQFLEASFKGLRPDWDAELPDGVGDVDGETTVISYALQRTKHFAAFQWFEMRRDGLLRWELFFLAPASSSARIGLRVAHGNLPAPKKPAWLDSLIPDDSAAPAQGLPGFLELVALLCSKGSVTTTSAATQQAFLEQQHELEYRRQLNEDLATELRQVSVKLRDVLLARAASAQFEDIVSDAPGVEVIQDLSELRIWALTNENRITILPRAFQGAKKSRYEDPEAVYAALELLAGPYREARLGNLEYTAFQAALAASEMQLDGSVGVKVAGEQGDAYFVAFQGRRRFMDLHLRKGGGREERYCLRIYFFWDEQSQKVVVGWLPSHLANSLS